MGNRRVEGGLSVFDTPEEGLTATIDNLLAKNRRHGFNNLSQVIGDETWGWAPASKGNLVQPYLDDLEQRTGFGRCDPIDLEDAATVERVVPAIIQHEQGMQPFSRELIGRLTRERLAQPWPKAGFDPSKGLPNDPCSKP